jgi:hypothetical protein
LKVRELELQDTKRRANAGLGTALTAGILGSLLDPLNVALAFVPIVGPARQTALAARLGVGGGRAATGAIEGAVGAAIIEPLVLGVAREEQADYTAVDSLANIVFGTAIGGGLHFSAGYIGDRFKARAEAGPLAKTIDSLPHQDQAALMRTAVAQAIEGRPIDVQLPLRVAVDAGGSTGSRGGRPAPEQRVVTVEEGAPSRGSSHPDYQLIESVKRAALDSGQYVTAATKDGDIKLVNLQDSVEGKIHAFDAKGNEIGVLSYVKVEQDGMRFNPNSEVVSAWQRKGVATAMYELADATGGKIPARDQPGQIRSADAIAFHEARYARQQAGKTTEFGDQIVATDRSAVSEAAIKDAVAKAQEPHIDKADSDGIAAADQRVADEANVKTIDDEATRMQEEVTELEAYSPEGIEPSQAVKDAAKEASLYARAWKAAAACGMRKA